jgi:RND family efflux transporter MFP subunit
MGMNRRIAVAGVAVALALGVGFAASQNFWSSTGAVAQAPKGKGKGKNQRPIQVVVAAAEKKKIPVRLEALGTVTPIASVAVKSRIDTMIVDVHFRDGAMVKQGDLLFTLDSRAIEAQLNEVEASLASAKAQLEQNDRDVKRYTELFAKNAATQVQLNNAKTQVAIWRAAVNSNTAKLEHLKIQLSYCTIRAPIAGRISMAATKVGNFVRPADPTPMATIIQIAPVYVTFTLPQRNLPDLRAALAAETATIQAIIPGDPRHADGQVTMIENTVDMATGNVAVRATMPNADDLLWPGTLVRVQLILREEDSVTVPATAVQASQTGSFVFITVKEANGVVARVQPITVARVQGHDAIIASGLKGGENVVTEGQLRIIDGSRVEERTSSLGS